MAAFDDIRLEWEGREYTIKSNRVLGALARVEDILTLSELQKFYQRGTAPMAKIAMAFGSLLRYAGAKVTDDDVATSLNDSNTEQVMAAIMALLMMMVPKSSPKSGKEADPGKSQPAATTTSTT